MKTDLATSAIAAIIGVIAAYFICNMILPPLEDVTIKTLSSGTTYTLAQPDPEVFNYRAVNPTVEVYVGQCAEYNEYGECIENIEYIEEGIVIEDESNSETENNVDNNESSENNNQNNENQENQENQTETNEETQNGTSN